MPSSVDVQLSSLPIFLIVLLLELTGVLHMIKPCSLLLVVIVFAILHILGVFSLGFVVSNLLVHLLVVILQLFESVLQQFLLSCLLFSCELVSKFEGGIDSSRSVLLRLN